MTQAEYIAAAFQRYFPTSSVTVDDETDDETIHVHVVTPTAGRANHFDAVSWVFEAGSDDDYYIFRRVHAVMLTERCFITIPLMPEA